LYGALVVTLAMLVRLINRRFIIIIIIIIISALADLGFLEGVTLGLDLWENFMHL